MNNFKNSELIITPEGRIYHLNLKEEEISDNIILVGAGVTGEEGADTMTVDQAQDTVAGMADSANELT